MVKIFRIFTALAIVKMLLLSVPIAEFAMATECSVDQAGQQKAATAFRKVLSVLRHPRCANCHGAINVYDEATTHPGGAMIDVTEDIFGDKAIVPKKAASCVMCHDEGNGLWIQKTTPTSEIQWANLSDRELWLRLQKTRIIIDPVSQDTRLSTGALLIDHVASDHLIDLAFQGKRGMGEGSYIASLGGVPEADPPPLTKSQFLVALDDWVEAMDASASWPEGDCSVVLEEPAAQEEKTIVPFEPDFSSAWTSTYGDIHWNAGWYGNKKKTLQFGKGSWDEGKNAFVMTGTWGRTTSSKSGGFKFVFKSACGFSGNWWYASSVQKKSGWSGACK